MYNHKLSKITLVVLTIVIIVIFMMCYFVYKDIKYKNQNHHIILSDLSFQNNKQDYLISTQKTMDDLAPDIKLINSSIISKEGDVGFIENLESIAKENSLSIEIDSLIFDNGLKPTSSSTDVLKIKAKTEGSWSNSYTFLARLESLPFKIKIDKFSLTSIPVGIVSGTNENYVSSGNWQSVFEIDVLKSK
ncbi:MAG: hypothetical protein NTX96_02560 [Candidatus Zambryskibacteria bacterium]|nr:hypothetical protein [Candidatus Zambryskibacteria bacterium]